MSVYIQTVSQIHLSFDLTNMNFKNSTEQLIIKENFVVAVCSALVAQDDKQQWIIVLASLDRTCT